MRAVEQVLTSDELDIRRIAGRIGAEVRGVTVSGDISDETASKIQAALARHKVIFFRGQTQLDDKGQEAFAERLGEPVAHPTIPVKSGKFLFELDSKFGGKANSWHSDSTFVPDYPRATVLRAVLLPELGGDTLWCNTASAYEHLPEALRAITDHLWAVHSNRYDYAATRPDLSTEAIEEQEKIFASIVYETEHPVVRVHPITGERTIVLGHFFKNFVGLSQADSARLYGVLQEHVTRPENTVRWHWAPGDVAIWDNRATQHYAIDDYGTQRRIMRRVTLAGDVPVSIDGRMSRQRKPDPSKTLVAGQ